MTRVKSLFVILILIWTGNTSAHEGPLAKKYQPAEAHAPTPLPDRVVLTWEDNPATTQSVTWRTDTSATKGLAHLAIANANGRALKPKEFDAETTSFQSDINEAHYHSVTFRNLEPDTIYAYRVGDGVNWTEYYHFKTASERARPFSFIYFGDAQNEVRTHWSRVFREAFRDAPRAAFTLHAGDLINEDAFDAEWGEWHQGPDWVNGTVPVVATPGNHEYYREGGSSEYERFWATQNGRDIEIDVASLNRQSTESGTLYQMSVTGPQGVTGTIDINDGGKIIRVDDGVQTITGFGADELVGSDLRNPPLNDRPRDPGIPMVSRHWRPQFAFPVQDVPDEALKETVYFIDYQGVRIISLDSNKAREAQIPWLRKVLQNNPNRWTILTFHHPIFSPASDRDNAELRSLWKPLLDEFKVDLVLTGHDHTYARTGRLNTSDLANIPTGYQQAYDPDIGTVYVVSVSGPKMYGVTKGDFAKRVAENTQLYQIIDVEDKTLRFRAFTATGELYDTFTLEKREGQPNLLIEALPPENRAQNTN